MKINILGTDYDLVQSNSGEDVMLEEADGYCDSTLKKCVIKKLLPSENSVGDLNAHMKRITRHEIIHAFLNESGLCAESWGYNEEIVDWIAQQFPKVLKAFEEADAL